MVKFKQKAMLIVYEYHYDTRQKGEKGFFLRKTFF